jgi:hypothetical protein
MVGLFGKIGGLMIGGLVGLPGLWKMDPAGGRWVPKIEKIGGRKVCITVVCEEGAVFIVVVGGVEKEDGGEEEGGHFDPITIQHKQMIRKW